MAHVMFAWTTPMYRFETYNHFAIVAQAWFLLLLAGTSRQWARLRLLLCGE